MCGRALHSLAITSDRVVAAVVRLADGDVKHKPAEISRSAEIENCLTTCFEHAYVRRRRQIGSDDLLLTLVEEEEDALVVVLSELGVDREMIRQRIVLEQRHLI